MKVVFFGTPDFAVSSLKKLIETENVEVLALITQPDKAIGRKQIITPPATKLLAEAHNIKILQPAKLSTDEETIKFLENCGTDYLVTCAYGQILKQNILDIAPVINVHASLLPDYRGPAPINWMLINGDTQVGVSTMLTDAGVDTGDVLLKAEITIDANTKADELTEKLSELGAELLIKTLTEFKDIKPEKQSPNSNPEKALAPFMDKRLGEISFTKENLELGSANPRQADFKIVKKNSAKNIHDLIRGSYPWPGAYFIRDGQKIIITDSETAVIASETKQSPGQISAINKEEGSFSIQTQDGELVLKRLKAQGKSELQSISWLNGSRLNLGDFVEN